MLPMLWDQAVWWWKQAPCVAFGCNGETGSAFVVRKRVRVAVLSGRVYPHRPKLIGACA